MNEDRFLRDLRDHFTAALKPLGETLDTALQRPTQVRLGEIRPVDNLELQADYPGDSVLVRADFMIMDSHVRAHDSGGMDGNERGESREIILALATRWAATWSDFMASGDGGAAFSAEAHLDATAECLSQICGTLGQTFSSRSGVAVQILARPAQLENVADSAHLWESHFRIDLLINLEGLDPATLTLLLPPETVQDLKEAWEANRKFSQDQVPPASIDENVSMNEESRQNLAGPEVRSARFEDLGSHGDHPAGAGQNIDMLMDLELPVIIELGRTSMFIRDILELGPGSIVELSKLSGEPVDLFVNDKRFALGEVVVIDENFGIRITDLVKVEDRIRSLK